MYNTYRQKRKLILTLFLFLPFNLFAESYTFGMNPGTGEFLSAEKNTLKVAYKTLGHEIKFISYPSIRSLKMSDAGLLDGEFFRIGSISEHAPNLIKVDVPLTLLPIFIFTHIDSDIKSTDDLKGKLISFPRGTKAVNMLSKKYQFRINWTDSLEAAFEMVHVKRSDAVLYMEQAGNIVINKNKFFNVLQTNQLVGKIPFYHFIHKKHGHLVKPLEALLNTQKKQALTNTK
jgi:polar amino acid transport system substrate-binding protein